MKVPVSTTTHTAKATALHFWYSSGFVHESNTKLGLLLVTVCRLIIVARKIVTFWLTVSSSHGQLVTSQNRPKSEMSQLVTVNSSRP